MVANSEPRVSVLIPTFNRERYLGECLESILAQTVRPFEVVVVDDGSDDATAERVASFGTAVRYTRKENGGKPRALNFAIPTLRGNFVWMFDDDDVALPTSLELRLNALAGQSELGFVLTGHYLGFDGPDGRIRVDREYRVPEIPDQELRTALMKGCFVTMPSMLVRADLLRIAGDFDERLATSEDYDMMLRLAYLAPFAILRVPTFIVRQHRGLRGSKAERYDESGRLAKFRKYDQVVGKKLRANLSLSAYLPSSMNLTLSPSQRVLALLTRMEVMASKGLLAEMFDDLREVLGEMSTSQAFTRDVQAAYRSAARNAVCIGYAPEAIADDFSAFFSQVRSIKREPGGRRAIIELGCGLLRLAKSYPGSVPSRLERAGAACRVLSIAIL